MPRNDIGGFFVSLGLELDRNSFETGNRLVDGVANSFNKLIGSAHNAANTLANITLENAKMGDSAVKMSEAFGISADALELWRATAKITTSSAGSLDSALTKLAKVKNGLKFGDSGLKPFQEQLDKIGMSYAKLKDLDPSQQLEEIFNFALKSSRLNKEETAQVLQSLLGEGAGQLYIKLKDKGYTDVGKYQQDQVQKHIFTNEYNFKDLSAFQEQVNIFDQSIDSLTKLLGSTLAKNLTEPLSNFNDWLVNHGDEITAAMDKLGTMIGKVLGETGETLSTAGSVVVDSADLMKGIVTAETPEERKKIVKDKGEALIESWKKPGEDAGALANLVATTATITDKATDEAFNLIDGIKEKYAEHQNKKRIEEDIETAYKKKNAGKKKKDYTQLIPGVDIDAGKIEVAQSLGAKNLKYVQLQDGIIRPDGTVAQVAPDDWVFAARNIGDMARAFIPQNYNSVSAPSEYNIVQNFTINGGNDIPQVIRQQAYQGTQDGLIELMAKSSTRLQLMSGTR